MSDKEFFDEFIIWLCDFGNKYEQGVEDLEDEDFEEVLTPTKITTLYFSGEDFCEFLAEITAAAEYVFKEQKEYTISSVDYKSDLEGSQAVYLVSKNDKFIYISVEGDYDSYQSIHNFSHIKLVNPVKKEVTFWE